MKKLSQLTTRFIQDKDSAIYELIGAIVKESEFSEIPKTGLKRVVFFLKQVSYINSGGVRTWMRWMSKIRAENPGLEVFFDEVPPFLVRQVIGVEGFFPKGAKVRSIYVPLFCSSCDSDGESFLVRAEQISADLDQSVLALEDHIPICKSCGGKPEIDLIHRDYFSIFGSAN